MPPPGVPFIPADGRSGIPPNVVMALLASARS